MDRCCTLLKGQELANHRLNDLKKDCLLFHAKYDKDPALAVVMVGHDAASAIYVRRKIEACQQVGIRSVARFLQEEAPLEKILEVIHSLNDDPDVHGILLQLPLPNGFASQVIESIDPLKDVDGLHPLNQGYLFAGTPRFIPCTPQGCLDLIHQVYPCVSGKNVLVVGRSVLVGRPLAILLTHAHATVTLAHSQTENLEDRLKEADIVVAAVGKPGLIKAVKPGALVIDVGINRTDKGLIGDVDFEAVSQMAGALTPVPGGVGPLTIAYLLINTVKAAWFYENKKHSIKK